MIKSNIIIYTFVVFTLFILFYIIIVNNLYYAYFQLLTVLFPVVNNPLFLFVFLYFFYIIVIDRFFDIWKFLFRLF